MAQKREITAREAKNNLEPFGYNGPARWSSIDAFIKANPRARAAVTANKGAFVQSEALGFSNGGGTFTGTTPEGKKDTFKMEDYYADTTDLENWKRLLGGETSGYTGVRVSISANDTNITVASAVKTALDSLSGFTTSVDGAGKVTFSGMTNTKNTEEVDSGFSFSNTKTYAGKQLLYSDATGSIEWKDADTIETAPSGEFIHWEWVGIFQNKSTSGNDDWHWLNPAGNANASTHTLNVGTSTPSVAPPNIALNAAVFYASSPVTIRNWRVMFSGTTAGEVVTLKLFKASPGLGTGNWTLTGIDTLTDTLSALEVKFEVGNSGASLATGDILLPAIKVDTPTNGNVVYRAHLEMVEH